MDDATPITAPEVCGLDLGSPPGPSPSRQVAALETMNSLLSEKLERRTLALDAALSDLRAANTTLLREQLRASVLLGALKDLSGMLTTAESNASGNPEWEYVSARVNAARAAIKTAEAVQ